MTELFSDLQARLADMRRDFDATFAAPIPDNPPAASDFISIWLGEDLHALALAQIDGLRAGVTVTPVPGPIPELRGVAGLRGALTPIYDLPMLLGRAAAAGHWVALAGNGAVGFAFDRLEGHFRVEPTAIAAEAQAKRGDHTHTFARTGARVLPIIDLVSVLAAMRQRVDDLGPKQE